MNYYIQGNKENADQIKAAFEKLGVASNANRYNYKNDYVLYFSAGGMMNMIDANGSWANIIKTHPDYKELELPVQPKFKFKVGDWTASIDDEGDVTVERIVNLCGNKVLLVDTDGCFAEYPKGELESCHIWTIADAKDGDVLALNGNPFIYSSHKYGKNYCYIDEWGQFRANFNLVLEGNCVCPATKQERDLLFSKMRKVGYQWDADKKELRKIQPHYDISNFKPFDKVLARQNDSSTWGVSFFGLYSGLFMCCTNVWFTQCIPFNEETKHLLGTTDMCPEEYVNW